MKRGRIHNVVEDTWGTGTVYSCEEFKSNMGFDRMGYSKTNELTLVSSSGLSHRLISHQTLSNLLFGLEHDMKVDKPNEGLPFFISSLFATVLEDLLIQLQCLEQCNYQLKIIKVLADENHLKTLKYGVKPSPFAADEFENINKNNLNDNIYKIRKLGADRNYINVVLQQTYLELAQFHTFYTMRNHIQIVYDLENHRIELEEEEARNKLLCKDLGKQVRQQRNHIKSAIYDCDVAIENLKSQVEDSFIIAETKSRYVGNWQNARKEQHNQTIFDKQNVPLTSIVLYKQKSEHEVRVHTEVEVLVNIIINETLHKVEEWMDKYDKDMDNMDLKIQLRKVEYQDQREKRIELTNTLEMHAEAIKNWIHFKEEREKARLYHDKMTNAALVVQAWWRGLIVRYKLGPFKVKKPPKPKKK